MRRSTEYVSGAEARRGPGDGDAGAGPEPRARRGERELEPARRAAAGARLVHEQCADGLQEGGVARSVRRQVHRAVVPAVERGHARGLARDVRPRRHRRGQHPVEAQDQLVGLVRVGEEAGDVDPVDRVGAAGRERGARVEGIGARADDPEQPGAVAEQVPERAAGLGAAGLEEPGGERVGHDEVPVAAEPRLRQRAVRSLAREQPRREEERPVGEPALRRADGSAEPSLQTCGECAAAGRERRVAGLRPHEAHLPQPLPDDGLRVEPEHRVRDVGRVSLGIEQAGAVALDLAAERVHVAAQGRRRLPDVRAVAREAVVRGRADELLTALPVRIRRRLPRQRRAQDRPRDARVAELGQHLRDVGALGERELLVRIADRVAPGQRQVLDQQVADRVVDPPLRHDDLGSGGESQVPVGGDRVAGALVALLVDPEGARPPRVVQPADVERARGSAWDAVGEHPSGRRLQAHPGCSLPRVDLESHEAREPARRPRRERLLPVAGAGRVDVRRLEDRQVAAGEMGRLEPAKAGAVALAAVWPDEDGEAPRADAVRDHLAPVGDVQPDRPGAPDSQRLREREVVDARVGQGPLARGACVEERRQVAAGAGVRRPVRRGEERVAPHVSPGAERRLDAQRVARTRARIGAGVGRGGGPRLGDPRKRGDRDQNDERRLSETSPILPRRHRPIIACRGSAD